MVLKYNSCIIIRVGSFFNPSGRGDNNHRPDRRMSPLCVNKSGRSAFACTRTGEVFLQVSMFNIV